MSRSTRILRASAGLRTRAVVSSAGGPNRVSRDNLISAPARSRASEALDTAASSAAISVASLHAFSSSAIPGNATIRRISFRRLSWRRTWTNSWRRAHSNSGWVNTNSAAPDSHTAGLRMPAAVSGGASSELRITETEVSESIKFEAVIEVAVDQEAIVREVRTKAAAAFQIPANTITMPQKVSASGISPKGSLTARGSSSRKEGMAKASVTMIAMVKGAKRRAKSRSAQRLAEQRWASRQILCQTAQMTTERTPYSKTKIDKETAIPR